MNLEDRKKLIADNFNKERLKEVNQDYLNYELKFMTQDNLEQLKQIYAKRIKIDNKNNSAVVYLLNFTDSYDPSRRMSFSVSGSGPDIDTDFSSEGREILVRKIQEKYGHQNVAKISTFTPWSIKTSVTDFTKVTQKRNTDGSLMYTEFHDPVYGSFDEGRKIAEQIPDAIRGQRTTWTSLSSDPMYEKLIKENQEVFNYSADMDGLPKNPSVHACGYIISNQPLDTCVPLRKSSSEDTVFVAEWEGHQLESVGYLKADLLVIDNLDISKDTCESIGKDYEWLDEISYNDDKAFDLINDGFTAGLFQIEESHVMDVIKLVNPRSIEDIAAITSVIRPGPRDVGLMKDYIKFRQTGKLQNKLHRLLDTVLKETGGVMIYQEQVLKALNILGGMSMETADEVRRAMGKKKEALMAKYEVQFLEGCKRLHNLEDNNASEIWSAIASFAGYGFNKSHAIAYSIITYQNAYLKAHYPTEYMLSLLSRRSNKPDKFQKYMREAKLMGINLRAPCINSSTTGFTKVNHNTIVFGFDALQGVGELAANKIVEARNGKPFSSLFDFFFRVDRSKINSKVMAILAKSGAFDSFGYNREMLVNMLPDMQKYLKDYEKYEENLIKYDARQQEIEVWQVAFDEWSALKKDKKVVKLKEKVFNDDLNRMVTWDPPRPKKPTAIKKKEKPSELNLQAISAGKRKINKQIIQWEYETCKFFISCHPLDFINFDLIDFLYIPIENIGSNCPKGSAIVAINSIETKTIKNGKNKGKKMAILSIQDYTGFAELILFAKNYELYNAGNFQPGQVLHIDYTYKGDIGEVKKLALMKLKQILL